MARPEEQLRGMDYFQALSTQDLIDALSETARRGRRFLEALPSSRYNNMRPEDRLTDDNISRDRAEWVAALIQRWYRGDPRVLNVTKFAEPGEELNRGSYTPITVTMLTEQGKPFKLSAKYGFVAEVAERVTGVTFDFLMEDVETTPNP